MWRWTLGLIAGAAALAIAIWLITSDTVATTKRAVQANEMRTDVTHASGPSPISVEGPSAAHSTLGSGPRTADARRVADNIREVLAARRAQALIGGSSERERVAQPSSSSAAFAPPLQSAPSQLNSMPAPVGSGNQVNQPLGEYVAQVVKKEFLPMGASCYQALLQKQATARGKITLDVTVVGDRSVGGVVDSVEVDADPPLRDEQFALCIRESMLGMSFQAPPEGHEKVTFTWPLELSPEPPDAGR